MTRGTRRVFPATSGAGRRPLGAVLKAAVVAGLIAGGAAAAFHLLLAERVMDRAIQIERDSLTARGVAPEEPLVSRRTQRVGLVVGLLFYGATWGLLFGAVCQMIGAPRVAGLILFWGVLGAAFGWLGGQRG